MRLRASLIALAWMTWFATGAAAMPKSVSVPAGDLIDAIESLAKQSGVDVVYPSALLKGRRTRGVDGTLEPAEAFRRLLEGTSLQLSEEGSALLITQGAAVAQPGADGAATVQHFAVPLPEVQVQAWREATAAAAKVAANEEGGALPAKWERHRLEVSCSQKCNYRAQITRVLRRLGARDIDAREREATFSVLAPADPNDADAKAADIVAASWERVALGPDVDADSVSPGEAIPLTQVSNVVLPLFTTRNVAQGGAEGLSVEVLHAVSEAALSTENWAIVRGFQRIDFHGRQYFCHLQPVSPGSSALRVGCATIGDLRRARGNIGPGPADFSSYSDNALPSGSNQSPGGLPGGKCCLP